MGGFSIRKQGTDKEQTMSTPEAGSRNSMDFDVHSLVQQSQRRLDQQTEEIMQLKEVIKDQNIEIKRLNQALKKADLSETPLRVRIQELEEIADEQDDLIRERDREIAQHEDKARQMDKLYHFRLLMAEQKMEKALEKEREAEMLVPNAEEKAAGKVRDEMSRRIEEEHAASQMRERRYRTWLIGALGYSAMITWMVVAEVFQF